MKIKPMLYVTQDGRDFYPCRDKEMSIRMPTWTSKIRVSDGDINAAQAARDSFIRQAEFSGYQVCFVEN